jgi:diguanylate cyclase (GGDEF)-like protein
MRQLIRLLHSWRQEERLTPLDRRAVLRAGGVCLLVLIPLTVLQLERRSAAILRQQQATRSDTVALMEAALSSTNRVARDWGHWDDAYRFARGTNPGYVRRNLGTGALFDGGGIMVMLRPDGSRLLAFTAPQFRLSSYAALLRCARDNRGRLPSLRSTLRVACQADNGTLYLGTATQISDNNATAPSAGTLVMFDPLLKPEYRSPIQQRLELLRRDLVFEPAGSRRFGADLELIQPPIHSSGGTLLAIRQQPLLPILGRALLEDLPLLLAIPLLLTILRVITLLGRRRRRIVQRQAERLASRRIRQACRQLDQLLWGIVPGDRQAAEPRHLLGRLSLEDAAAPVDVQSDPAAQGGAIHERELARVTDRFQRFLQSASSLALLDPLTQLPNRRYFIAQLADAVAHHSANGQHFALLFVDVDKFKVINDTYGHAVGDAVLVSVCQRLRGVLRSGDFMARYGGDELAVILDLSFQPDQSPQGLNRAARDQAHAMVESLVPPVLVGDLPIAVSLSIGITLVDPLERDVTSLIQRSDLAMYQAKRSRSGRIVGPDDVGQAPLLNSYQLFSDLIQAIRSRQLQVFFQPIVSAEGHRHGFEALARWQHPQRGWIEPFLFLEMAEQHRQMQLLGHELIRLSLDGFQRLRQLEPSLRFYLNLAPNQLLEPDLADRLLSQLRDRSLPAEQLTLELTEHSILEPHETVSANLAALRQAGLRLALDDFGTGYSSLVLLKSLRPDVVKIDKSFIQAIRHDPDALHIITLIAALAPRLDLELIAEGIEDREVLKELEPLGIGLFQGFAFGRPSPLQDWLVADPAIGSSDSRAIV